MVKASDTGGVKPFPIETRLREIRERLLGMTDEERAYRKQWLKDQELSPNEPRNIPELYKERYNIIRRAYRYPLNQFQNLLAPLVGAPTAYKIRYFTGKIIMGYILICSAAYYFQYNQNSWIRKGGFRAIESRAAVVPGDADFPKLSEREKGSDYAHRGFKDCKLNL